MVKKRGMGKIIEDHCTDTFFPILKTQDECKKCGAKLIKRSGELFSVCPKCGATQKFVEI